MTLVDTNVLLDLVTADPVWGDWSVAALDAADMAGPILINDVVYAELSARFTTIEALDLLLEDARIGLAPTPRAALFAAGKAFLEYRRAGGARTGVLPDFFIGPCRNRRMAASDTRHGPLRTLLSQRPTDHAERWRRRMSSPVDDVPPLSERLDGG